MYFVEYGSLFSPKLFKNAFKKRIVLKKKERTVGDTLLLSAMAREIKRVNPDIYIITETLLPELFFHNPNVDENRGWHIYSGKNNVRTWYNIHQDQQEHVIHDLLRALPYTFKHVDIGVDLFLTQEDKSAAQKILQGRPSMSIMSSGKVTFSENREWSKANFQHVVDYFNKDFQLVQIGDVTDVPCEGVLDCRGKTLRETAAIINESLLFIGQEGGLMHLANGVKKRSVIIYGGYLHPSVTGYRDNMNLYVDVECAPCYTRKSGCTHRKCMKLIQPKDVIQAAEKLLPE